MELTAYPSERVGSFTVMPPAKTWPGARNDEAVINRLKSLSMIGAYRYGAELGLPGTIQLSLPLNSAGEVQCNNNGKIVTGPPLSELCSGLAHHIQREIFSTDLGGVMLPSGTLSPAISQDLDLDMWTMLISPYRDDDWMHIHDFAETLDVTVQHGQVDGWTAITFAYGQGSDVDFYQLLDPARIRFQITRRGASYWIGGLIGERRKREPLFIRLEPQVHAIEMLNCAPGEPADLLTKSLQTPAEALVPGADFFHPQLAAELQAAVRHGQVQDKLASISNTLQIPPRLIHMLQQAPPLELWSTIPGAITVGPRKRKRKRART